MASVHRLYETTTSGPAKRKLRSQFWYAKFRASDGSVVMRATRATKRTVAVELARQWERDARKIREGELTETVYHKNVSELLERVGLPVLSTVSVEQFFRDWLEAKRKRGSAPSTLVRYGTVVDAFLSSLGSKSKSKLASVSVRDIERFYESELEVGKGATTATFGVAVVRSVFNTARRQGLIATNPVEQIETVSARSEEREPFTADQVRALLSVANNEWRGAILFGYHCGLRLSEATSLTWANLDLVQGAVVYRPVKRRKNSPNREVKVSLHDELRDYLMQLPAGDKPDAPLFPSLNGRQTGGSGGLSIEFVRIMRKAGIDRGKGAEKKGKGRAFSKLSNHSLRHSFISNLANADVSSDVRKELVGHSSDEAHARYVHLDLETQRRAISRVPRLVE